MPAQHIIFKDDSKLSIVSQQYADDNEMFLEEFATAWQKLSKIDRFDGPLGNLCDS